MEAVKGFCPKCGNPVVLMEYGLYLSKELKRFEHVFEGWCPNCVERVVEHSVPESSEECAANEAKLKTAK
jgi:hypothetical protein